MTVSDLHDMFIAHLPSGYLLAVQYQHLRSAIPVRIWIAVGMAGAVAPDLDLAYFFLVDHQHVHHHRYFSHWPLFWLGLTLLLILVRGCMCVKQHAVTLGLLFCTGALLHVFLDTVAGDIWWLAPFIDKPFSWVKVPDRFSPWWLNFLLHGSFLAELLICGRAYQVYRSRRIAGGATSNCS